MQITFKQLTDSESVNLSNPSGKLYVGDPCYVFPDGSDAWNWGDFCEALYEFTGQACRVKGALVLLDDKPAFIVSSTAYGDGSYPVHVNGALKGAFSVDSGLFAIIPVELLQQFGVSLDDEKLLHHVQIVEAEGNLSIESIGTGTLSINVGESQLSIDTDDEDEDDAWDEDWDEEEDWEDEEE